MLFGHVIYLVCHIQAWCMSGVSCGGVETWDEGVSPFCHMEAWVRYGMFYHGM